MSAAAPAETPGTPPAVDQAFSDGVSVRQRLAGLVPPLFTAVLAFLMGGIVVAATGHNPWTAYKAIWNGTGINWIYSLPWDTGSIDALNLQQTLLLTTTLILCGLAVAFPFRCGLFNIGGQGQYVMGLIVAHWVGVSIPGAPGPLHVLLGVLAAIVAGGVWAGIAGFLKAAVGAHEVISTIMLNWVAYWFGSYVFGQGGPLQNPETPASPISADIATSARVTVFWGDAELQGLHIGLFVAIAMLGVYWLLLNRTTLGYQVRAVGFNPEGARYGGISVKKSYFLAMAISGGFAGLAGGFDMLGYLYRFGTLDVQSSSIGFLGIAVALLGRNTAVGVGLSALLFGGLLYGTSSRSLDPDVFAPDLAGNLTLMIQGLVVLFVGADLLILYLWNLRRKRLRAEGLATGTLALPRAVIRVPRVVVATVKATAGGLRATANALRPERLRALAVTVAAPPLRTAEGAVTRLVDPATVCSWAALAKLGLLLAALAFWITVAPVHARSVAWPIALGVAATACGLAAGRRVGKLGWAAAAVGPIALALGIVATRSSVENLDVVFTWSTLTASALVFATPLTFAALGGMFSERSGVVNIGLEGMMLMGAFWGIWGADKTDSWFLGILIGMAGGGLLALLHAYFAIHLRADQIVGGTAINFLALGITGFFFVDLYSGENIPAGVSKIPNVDLGIRDWYFVGPAFGNLNLMIWAAFATVILAYVVMFKTPIGLRIRACGEHPRAADTVGLNVYAIRYGSVVVSGLLSAAGGAYLTVGYLGTYNDNVTAGRGFIALAALIFGNWRPFRAFGAALLFGFSTALASNMGNTYDASLPGIGSLIQMLPYVLTLIAVAGVIGRSIPPAAVGKPYKKQ